METKLILSKTTILSVLILSIGINSFAHTPIRKYATDPGAGISPNFSLKVNGTESVIVEKTQYLSYAKFWIANKPGAISIQISVNAKTLDKVSLWPRKLGLAPAIDKTRKTITFNLDNNLTATPQKFIVKADSQYLAIFVDLPETDQPLPTDANVKNIMDFGVDNTGTML